MRGYFSENNMEFEDIKLVKNIAFTTGGPRFPIAHALRSVLAPPPQKKTHMPSIQCSHFGNTVVLFWYSSGIVGIKNSWTNAGS